jgi:hypothetical protein
VPLVLCRRVFLLAPYVVNSAPFNYTLAAVKLISPVRPSMDYQLSQHTPTTQWSDTPESQHQQMSQHYSPSQHRTAALQSSSLTAWLSPLQVSSSTMHLQSSTHPKSPLTTHASYIQRHTQHTLLLLLLLLVCGSRALQP